LLIIAPYNQQMQNALQQKIANEDNITTVQKVTIILINDYI